jgi:acyl-CoA thioester hydrolase
MESRSLIRVRYAETDAMGIVHHAVYPVWMELGRSDLLRELGQSYAEWETQGVFMPLGELHVRYRQPARYDEQVEVFTRIQDASRRKITFGYRVMRGDARLVEASTVHIVTGTSGRSQPLPESLWKLIETAMRE